MARTSLNPLFLGYYVDEAAINSAFPVGQLGQFVNNADTDTVWAWNGSAWVDTTNAPIMQNAAGSTTQVIFNDGGAWAGDAGLIYDKTGNILHVDHLEIVGGSNSIDLPDSAGTMVVATSGAGAPGTTPAAIGLVYVRTSNQKVYISTGTSSSADWTILN